MNQMEILAPAGGFDSVEAAARCGADAVYLGAKVLNARRHAENFGERELADTVRYCHIRGMKVYLTLNTLLFDSEILSASQVIGEAGAADIDGVIVQDLGVAQLVREICPGLPLHGSTQMAVHNPAGAKLLEKMGFARVVLARELSLREIEEIAAQTAMELEVFVHGALCMCISGQCYLSSVIGERSGNRGLCAQPCRLPFQAEEGGSGYALSLKDLSAIGQLEALGKAGVRSLKIEGRMKRPEYVAAAVTACKQALAGKQPDLDKLRAVFSRSGFTNGYLTGELGPQMFGTRQKEDVVSAQGVLKEYAGLYHKEVQRVPVAMEFSLQPKVPASLTVRDQEGREGFAQGAVPEQAFNKPTTPEMAEQSLKKTGSTPYFVTNAVLDVAEGLVLPVSQLNAMRREALECLDNKRALRHSYKTNPPVEKHFPKLLNLKYPTIRARFHSLEQIPQDMVERLDKILLPVPELFNSFNNPMLKTISKDKIIAELPRISFGQAREEKLREQLRFLYAQGFRHGAAGNLGAFQLAAEQGFSVLADWGLNISNTMALEQYRELGAREAVVSFELGLPRAKALGDALPYGILGYGYLPLMITRNCPIRNALQQKGKGCGDCKQEFHPLTDRRGNKFMVSCQDGDGSAQLYNSVPLYLADRLPELEGFSFVTLYFTRETPEQVRRVTEAYFSGRPKEWAGLEQITRGLYYRNVL